MPTPESILAAIIFGFIGMAGFLHGKRLSLTKPLILGILLMGYPYFITETWLVFTLGAGLSYLLYLCWE